MTALNPTATEETPITNGVVGEVSPRVEAEETSEEVAEEAEAPVEADGEDLEVADSE